MTSIRSAIVAGHICLDIIPALEHLPPGKFLELFQPGQLLNIGEARFSTGGPVSNTGLALHILGVPTRLVAKIGADIFGDVILKIVARYGNSLTEGIRKDPVVHTSYTVIVSPPGMDRIFLHYSGANDAFYARDIDYSLVAESDLFHFGYPPVMRTMYTAGGRELLEVFRLAKATGATTSLDMTLPSPASQAAEVDWKEILEAVLPFVDIFAPSIEELFFLLQRDLYTELSQRSESHDILPEIGPELLGQLGQEMLAYGARIVLLKLGYRGAYLRTGSESALGKLGKACPENLVGWADQELWAPCFKVQVTGTTGSGDATISGFLGAILRGYSARQALSMAVAVGACNVEAPDALSGLRSWDDTLARIASGWERQPLDLSSAGWIPDAEAGLWIGPATRSGYET